MNITVQDQQIVGETDNVLWSTIQAGAVSLLVSILNVGTNTMNYHFQQFNGTAWVDMGTLSDGTNLVGTLSSEQTINLVVNSTFPQVRMSGSASGGSVLDFTITRRSARTNSSVPGGAIPVLSV